MITEYTIHIGHHTFPLSRDESLFWAIERALDQLDVLNAYGTGEGQFIDRRAALEALRYTKRQVGAFAWADHDWRNAVVTYWFFLDNSRYGIVESVDEPTRVVDDRGRDMSATLPEEAALILELCRVTDEMREIAPNAE
jgi:hypothetical protein